MERPVKTPFAEAIEAFLCDVNRGSNGKTNFYQEALAGLGEGSDKLSNTPDGAGQSSLHGAQSLATYIEELARTRKHDSKTLRLADRLRPLVNGLSQFTTACDVMIQAAPAAAVVVYGGARLLLQLAQKSYECHDTIVDMLAEIGHLLTCYDMFAAAHSDSMEMHDVLVSSYKTIVKFWQKAFELLNRKTYKLILLSAVKPLDKEWQKCHESLKRDRERVQLYAIAVNAKVRNQRDSETKTEKLYDLKKEVASWIRGAEDDESLDSRSTVRTNGDKRHPGTCDWLFDHPDYQTWETGNECASLFLSAAPGAGKTIMASAVARHLRDRDMRAVAFFYSFNDIARRNPMTALRSLALQLLALHDGVPEGVQKYYRADIAHHCNKLNDPWVAVEVVKGLTKQLTRVHIIIDGLDECRSPLDMLVGLRLLLEAKPFGVVKWFFTCRPERQIRAELSRCGATEISAPVHNLTNDIRTFMRDRLQDNHCLDRMDDWIGQAEGNFLWAALVLQTIDGEGLTCEEDVEEELSKFPQGLTGCYLRTLHQLARRSERQQELARKIFAFLVVCVQPPRLSELSHALAATTSSSDYSSRRVPTLALIEELCSHLVTFDRTAKGSIEDPVLRFAHKSIQDFLLLDRSAVEAPPNVQRFFTTALSANAELGMACVRYLSFDRYKVPHDVETMIKDSDHAFLQYAATYWFRHLSEVPPTPELRGEVGNFMSSSTFWNCIFVQCRVAPHLYGRFRKLRGNSFSIQTGSIADTGPADSVRYGSPVPIWMGSTQVKDLHTFVVQWHQVLNSHPDQVRQCVMDDIWNTRWPKKLAWGLESPRCCTIRSVPSNLEDVISQLSLAEPSLGYRLQSLRESSIDIDDFADPTVHDGTRGGELTDEEFLRHPRSLNYYASNLHVLTGGDEDNTGNYDPNAQGDHAMKCCILSYASNLVTNERNSTRPSVAVQWRYALDRTPNKNRNRSPHDSGFESVDSGDDSEKEDASDVEDESALEGGPSMRRNFLKIMQAGRKPIFYSWNLLHSHTVIKTAFHPTKPWALWSPSAHECCIADLESGSVEKIVLPEPADVDIVAADIVHKEFYCSGRDDLLYYLIFAVTGTDSGLDGVLSLSVFNLEHRESRQRLLHRTALATTLKYSWTGDLQVPFMQSFWNTEFVVVALPQLSCDPKVVRLILNDQHSSLPASQPSFETLVKPIFFPASTPHRDPSLHYISSREGRASLVLTLDGEQGPEEAEISEHDNNHHNPILMTWSLDDHADWRAWDPAKDGQSDAYRSAHSMSQQLRGSYVAADQRYCVPIRSGLDWRKQAFVTCS